MRSNHRRLADRPGGRGRPHRVRDHRFPDPPCRPDDGPPRNACRARPAVRAVLRAGEDRLGLLVGHLPATRGWERADQDLLELFASEIGVAVRNAQLFERVGRRTPAPRARRGEGRLPARRQPQPPDAADEHPRLCRAAGGRAPDRRLGIIAEQADRLCRMVRQLLTVTRLEAGTLQPRSRGPRARATIRRAWEALGVEDVDFRSTTRPAAGWPWPTPTSSTRCCGRCSTTRSSTAGTARRGAGRRRRADGSVAADDRRPRPGHPGGRLASGCSTGSAGSASSRPRTAAVSASTCRASSSGR